MPISLRTKRNNEQNFVFKIANNTSNHSIVLLLPARAHGEHEAGVGQALLVDGPPLQLVPARSTLAFFFLLSLGGGQVAKVDAGLSKGAGDTRLALSAPPLGRPKLVPQGHLPCGPFFFPHFFLASKPLTKG